MPSIKFALVGAAAGLLILSAGCTTKTYSERTTTSTPPVTTNSEPTMSTNQSAAHLEHPFLFHLIQKDLWEATKASGRTYFPPTYDQDGFTHATANPDLLLNVANHFYTDVPGDWLCLKMTVESLQAADVRVIFEGTAPVGDKQPEFAGSDDELFPHILGGIPPQAVLDVFDVDRTDDGRFMMIHYK